MSLVSVGGATVLWFVFLSAVGRALDARGMPGDDQ
jgi:hypothetical protein